MLNQSQRFGWDTDTAPLKALNCFEKQLLLISVSDPDSDPCVRVIQFQKKKLKIILENIFLLKKVPIFFKNYQNKISPKEIVILLSL